MMYNYTFPVNKTLTLGSAECLLLKGRPARILLPRQQPTTLQTSLNQALPMVSF